MDVTFSEWRAKVEKELAGKSYEKALVHETPEGIAVQPLYIEAPSKGAERSASAVPFRICMRHEAGASDAALKADVEEGADALWVPEGVTVPTGVFAVIDSVTGAVPSSGSYALNFDPIGAMARGGSGSLAGLSRPVPAGSTGVMVSTLPYHEMGAHAVDELAFALATGVRYFEAMLGAGLTPEAIASTIALQTSVGRDTFLELCKVRALRTVWAKVLVAFGAKSTGRTLIHAVCASRTMTTRDPWVNMLRVTTQVFAAVLGGADVVTPNAFDQALGLPSAHGRRVARNTGLVLREESLLGKVADPAGGAYAFETLTDELARKAWARFQSIEKSGGIVVALQNGSLKAGLDAAWKVRLGEIAKRKIAILGVSEFANVDEVLPETNGKSVVRGVRDSETFETLRDQMAGRVEPGETPVGRRASTGSARAGADPVALLTLGTPAESRPRVGFASSFFAAGGLRTHEVGTAEKSRIACVCGPDELYASHGVDSVKALKAAGCERIVVAGRPGALEKPLRDAGVDAFIFVGCDAVSILTELVAS